MTLEWTQVITYPIIDIAALFAVFFAVGVVLQIYKKKDFKGIKRTFVISFGLLAAGYILYAIAELVWDVLTLMGKEPELGVPDYLWVAGMIFVFAGLFYLALYMLKQHKERIWERSVIVLSVAVISAGILYYLIGNFILGFQEGESAFEIFLDYFYPIGSAMIFIVSVATYTFYKELKALGKPLLMIALSVLFTFIADMFYTYYSWNEVYGITGLLSELFYVGEYVFAAVGFYLLYKVFQNPHNARRIKFTK